MNLQKNIDNQATARIFFNHSVFSTAILIVFLHFPLLGAGAENIRINQIGFYQFGPKTAVVVSADAWRFSVKSTDLKTTYYAGQLAIPKKWDASGETVSIADFSEFTRPGTYVLDVGGVGVSYPFSVGASVHGGLLRGLLRMFYYQRASTSLPDKHAGTWSRNAGHPDLDVIVHSSAVSDSGVPNPRKAGQRYPSPGGWYDAGDYGKYVVNAGISTYTLLALYEQFPVFFDTFSFTIPRSVAQTPDLLTEIKWELDWLLTMQDPADGGVYHKLTSLNFCGFVMPDDDKADRYFIGKGAAATFDFAAVCAVASRVYKKKLPGFADSCLGAAQRAWKWGSLHPNKAFTNPDDVVTGEYGNGNLQDEQSWAANELFLATGDSVYRRAAENLSVTYGTPGWPDVGMLGMFSLAFVDHDSAAMARIAAKAQSLSAAAAAAPYRTLPVNQGDFYWGSNAMAANYGMILIEAFLATGDSTYFERAVDVLDYLTGRNAVGVCFVTGFGSKSPLSPHYRPSAADGIAPPVPGFLVGGPNRSLQRDEGGTCGADAYKEKFAAKIWIDNECSYGSNEVAINWNAPAAFLAGAIEAVWADGRFHVKRPSMDSLTAAIDSIAVGGLGADRATISWKTDRPVSSSIRLGLDSTLADARRKFSAAATEHRVSFTGLTSGARYYCRIACIDDFGGISESGLFAFTTVTSPLETGFSFEPSSLKAVPGSAMVISFKAAQGIGAEVIYSRGGDTLKRRLACSEINGDYQATIPAADITPAGLFVSISLARAADTLTTTEWAVAAASPVSSTETIARPFTYSLISLPIPVPIAHPSEFFKPFLGGEDAWRYFGYDPSTKKYVSNAAVGGGRGGWLFTGEKRAISVEAAPMKPDTLFPIPLSQGWNCIGNPFSFPVFWENSMVRYRGKVMRIFDKGACQLIRRQIFYYTDTTSDRMNNGRYTSNREILASDSTRLIPWKGYWAYAETEDAELLIHPSAEKPALPLAKRRTETAGEWHIGFALFAGGVTDNMAVIGESPAASDGFDELDSPKPPPPSDEAVLGVLHPHLHGNAAMFASDILGPSQTSAREWRLGASSKNYRENIVLSWENPGSANGFFYLHDVAAGATIDMSTVGTYVFSLLPGEESRIFVVEKTAARDARFASMPGAWALRQGWPNPFRKASVFAYSVPCRGVGEFAARSVAIAVYDVNGRRLRTLFKGLRDPGTYEVMWDGADDRHKRLGQGVYLVRFSAEGFSGTIPTHLMD